MGDDENSLCLSFKRFDDLLEEFAQTDLNRFEGFAASLRRVARRILEGGADVVVGESANGRPLVGTEVDFVKAVVHGWFDAVRGEKNLRGVPSPMVGAHEGPVEAVARSDEAVPRDLGLADAACVDVD